MDLRDVPGGPFEIIYADPPWTFTTRGKRSAGDRNPDQHYPTMKLADIKALPVAEIAAKNSMLFLWTSGPWLAQSIEVMRTWGFSYSTYGFVWVKLRPGAGSQSFMHETDMTVGLGYNTRANAELVLIGRRGSIPRASKSVRQLVFAERREHSRKPETVRERIVHLMGDRPRLEMFARERFPGWAAWGLETEKFAAERKGVLLGEEIQGPPAPAPHAPIFEAAE